MINESERFPPGRVISDELCVSMSMSCANVKKSKSILWRSV